MASLKECQAWYDRLEPDDEEDDVSCVDEPDYYEEDEDREDIDFERAS
mgnify:FL=1